jgi:ribosomal protein S18 acetylase RimI-like enzyme
MHITPFTAARFDELVDFITRLSDDPAHLIGYLGQGRADIVHELGDLDRPLEERFFLAEADGRLVGAMGFEADEALGRAWLLGPFADGAPWQLVAEAQWAAVQAVLPPAVTQLELFGHVDNENLARFALLHGFTALQITHLLTLPRPLYPPPATDVVDLPGALADEFAALHTSVFPNTYYSAEQLLAMRDDRHRLLAHCVDGRLLAYAFLQIIPDTQEAYLDFIAVDEAARGRGAGKQVLAAVVRAAFERPEIDHLNLTVDGDNTAAYRLYLSAGFEVVRSMRGYRKTRGALFE